MSKVKPPKPIGYFACNPKTLEPVWHESCVCEDNIYNQEDMNTVGRAIIFADQAKAYKDSCVREALAAAKELADWAEHEVGADIDLTPGLAAIRALIPPLPGPVEPTT